MITIKSEYEIAHMRRAGKILAETLQELRHSVKSGTPAFQLENKARELIKKSGGRPSFLNYRPAGAKEGFPAALCVSINDEIVHGIPDAKVIREGDLVSLDLGVEIEGYHTDAAITFGVGKVPYLAENLMRATEEALSVGIRHVKAGETVGEIGWAVQGVLEKNKLGVVRELVGHGIGRSVHEDPAIPNYGERGTGTELKAGMTICIEPMATLGSPEVIIAEDGWTYKTADGLLSAHFEHTVLVTNDGYEVLTALNH